MSPSKSWCLLLYKLHNESCFSYFALNISPEFLVVVCCWVAKLCLTLATPWTVAHQAPLSMGSPRQEYQSGLLFASPGDLPDPGIKPKSPVLHANSLPLSRIPCLLKFRKLCVGVLAFYFSMESCKITRFQKVKYSQEKELKAEHTYFPQLFQWRLALDHFRVPCPWHVRSLALVWEGLLLR